MSCLVSILVIERRNTEYVIKWGCKMNLRESSDQYVSCINNGERKVLITALAGKMDDPLCAGIQGVAPITVF